MNHCGQVRDASFTALLLDCGADPNVRTSLGKRLHPGMELMVCGNRRETPGTANAGKSVLPMSTSMESWFARQRRIF
jgi:hypothetical protein